MAGPQAVLCGPVPSALSFPSGPARPASPEDTCAVGVLQGTGSLRSAGLPRPLQAKLVLLLGNGEGQLCPSPDWVASGPCVSTAGRMGTQPCLREVGTEGPHTGGRGKSSTWDLHSHLGPDTGGRGLAGVTVSSAAHSEADHPDPGSLVTLAYSRE